MQNPCEFHVQVETDETQINPIEMGLIPSETRRYISKTALILDAVSARFSTLKFLAWKKQRYEHTLNSSSKVGEILWNFLQARRIKSTPIPCGNWPAVWILNPQHVHFCCGFSSLQRGCQNPWKILTHPQENPQLQLLNTLWIMLMLESKSAPFGADLLLRTYNW